MVFGFYFSKKYDVIRRLPDGTVENFTAEGISRMEYSVNIREQDFNAVKYFFIFSPDTEIRTMDIVVDGDDKVQIGKVIVLNDGSGAICGYRCESL